MITWTRRLVGAAGIYKDRDIKIIKVIPKIAL